MSQNNSSPGIVGYVPSHNVAIGAVTSPFVVTGVAPGVSGTVLASNGTTSDPSFQTLAAAGAVTSITGDTGGAESPSSGNFNIKGTANQVLVAGTANTETISLIGPYAPSTYTDNGVLYGNVTSSIGATAEGATGQVLQGNTGNAPTYSTATYPSTTTANQVLFSSATNVVGGSANLTFNSGTSTLAVPTLTLTNLLITPYRLSGTFARLSATTGAISNSETIVVGGSSTYQIPANSLIVGNVIRVTLSGTCTSSAANVSTFNIRLGTAGTTSDGIILTAATAAAALTGTAIPFKVVIEAVVTAIGAGATIQGNFTLWNKSGAAVGTACTGIVVVTNQMLTMTPTGFNTTVANFIEATYVSAASTTACTFQVATIEIL